MTKFLLLSALATLTAGSAAAQHPFQVIANDPWCREDAQRERGAVWCEVRQALLPPPNGVVAVDASPNGAVQAAGWDRTEIRVRAKIVVRAATEVEARQLAAAVSLSGSSPYRAQGPANRPGNSWSASFDVSVPHHSDLKLTSVNGPVAVADVEGQLELDTENGPLSVSGAAGSVKGRTSNGPLSVRLTGSSWSGEGLDVTTTNGPVTLTIPQGYDAQLETGTANGPVNLGFPLTVSGSLKRDIRTTLGNGGALVRVRTTNGPLNLKRP
jgi:Putative adhesin